MKKIMSLSTRRTSAWRLRNASRELIEEIRLVPKNGKLQVELYGELAALLNLTNEHPRSKGTG